MRLIDADALMELCRNNINGTVDCNDIARVSTVCDIERIKAEIQKPIRETRIVDTETQKAQIIALAWCLEIIDKYTKGDAE